MKVSALNVALAVLAGLFIVLCLDIGRLALTPTREASIDAVRIRNAIVAELGQPADTDWQPDAVPPDYHWESLATPDYFTEVVRRVVPDKARTGPALTTALRLAGHLRKTSRDGQPIQANTRETYEKIVSGGGGYCSDYTQSFNALALAAGLQVRECGFTWEDMANGHAFNEVWAPEFGKWVFIDSFVSFYVVDAANGEPLSALEFRAMLMGGSEGTEIEVVRIVPDRFGFETDSQVLAWYRRGVPRMFLLLGNGVFSYDANPVIQAAEVLPRSVEMVLAILLGEHPRFLFVPEDSAPAVKAQVEAMQWELNWVLIKIAAIVVLGFGLMVWLCRLLRHRADSEKTASGVS